MPIMIGGARLIGADFHCHLVEYIRTTVFRIPSLMVKGSNATTCVILDEPEFKATVVVDPFS